MRSPNVVASVRVRRRRDARADLEGLDDGGTVQVPGPQRTEITPSQLEHLQNPERTQEEGKKSVFHSQMILIWWFGL